MDTPKFAALVRRDITDPRLQKVPDAELVENVVELALMGAPMILQFLKKNDVNAGLLQRLLGRHLAKVQADELEERLRSATAVHRITNLARAQAFGVTIETLPKAEEARIATEQANQQLTHQTNEQIRLEAARAEFEKDKFSHQVKTEISAAHEANLAALREATALEREIDQQFDSLKALLAKPEPRSPIDQELIEIIRERINIKRKAYVERFGG